MKLIKVGAAILNQIPLGWEHNRRNILGAIDEARRSGVTLLCLPELCVTGQGCEDAFQSPALQRTALEVLLEIVPATEGRQAGAQRWTSWGRSSGSSCATASITWRQPSEWATTRTRRYRPASLRSCAAWSCARSRAERDAVTY